jgi:hypothetical protein
MFDLLLNNLPTIATIATVAYPPLLFLLPASTASKINVGVKVVKAIATALETAEQTKGGLSNQKEIEQNKRFVQKAKN